MGVVAALEAIAGTGRGHCWYCDLKLPAAEGAISSGWDVQRVEGGRVASIIVVCPTCVREKADMGMEEFLLSLSLRVCNTAC